MLRRPGGIGVSGRLRNRNVPATPIASSRLWRGPHDPDHGPVDAAQVGVC